MYNPEENIDISPIIESDTVVDDGISDDFSFIYPFIIGLPVI